ncbi:MAG: hypothetical protein ACKOWF_06785 [Chloroflexota bacterium]
MVAVVAAAAVSAVLLAAADLWRGPLPDLPGADPAPAHPAGPVAVAAAGILVTVPGGTATEYATNGHRFELPPVIELRSGQSIEVRNDDLVTHVILGMAVPAGETRSRTAGEPGYEVYSAGCAAHAAGSAMTTLVISGPPAQTGG